MRDKLNWESHKVAEFLRTKRSCGSRSACSGCRKALLGTRHLGSDHLEPVGGVDVPDGTVVNPLA